LNDINVVKDGCFGAVFMEELKGLGSSGRKSRDLSMKRAIDNILCLLLTAGFE
jgi:hypothetical protein